MLGILALLISSTSYFLKKLIHSIEYTYSPIFLEKLGRSEKYYINMLGSGTSLDDKLPASMNLSSTTLTRLFKGVRVLNYLTRVTLVTSASGEKGLKSQAQMCKEASISLGVKENRIEMLKKPTTTVEEAVAFKEKLGMGKKLIIATSALHMPRAIEIFKDQGLNAISAPCDYFYKECPTDYNGITFLSVKSLELMNVYQITLLKKYYFKWFIKQ